MSSCASLQSWGFGLSWWIRSFETSGAEVPRRWAKSPRTGLQSRGCGAGSREDARRAILVTQSGSEHEIIALHVRRRPPY
jgi:hypothetical protein